MNWLIIGTGVNLVIGIILLILILQKNDSEKKEVTNDDDDFHFNMRWCL